MGYVVLWIESLAVSLLLAALLVAAIGRLRGVWRRRVWGVLVLLPIFVTFALLTSIDGLFESRKRVHTGLFWPLLSLTFAYLVGAAVISRRGLRIQAMENMPAAVSWPRAKLALVLLAAVVLHIMTFANLDAAARQSLATVQTEASALAASVMPERVPDGENAAVVYQQAFDAMGPKDEWPQVWRNAVDALQPAKTRSDDDAEAAEGQAVTPFNFQAPELIEFLKDHAGELALFRVAAARPGCYFDKNYARLSFDMPLVELQQLRRAARLLAVDARRLAARGDLRGALADVNALFSLAGHAGAGPTLVSMLVAAAIDGLACDTMQEVLGSTVATEDHFSDIFIDGAASYRRLLARAMRMEEAFVTSLFANMDRVDNLQVLQDMFGGIAPPMQFFGPLYRVFLQAHDLAAYRTLMHEHEQLSAKPYREAKAGWEALQDRFDRQPRGLLTALLTPALGAANEAAFQAEARRRVAETALGMHRYRAARGQFADKLDDLAPDFLPVVPRDPFDGQRLRLEKNARGWVVYSVGPDLVENQGLPFNPNDKQGDIGFQYAGPREEESPK